MLPWVAIQIGGTKLVGGFNPKNISQNGNLFQVRMNMKNI